MYSLAILSTDAVLFEMDNKTAEMFDYFLARMPPKEERKKMENGPESERMTKLFIFMEPFFSAKTLKKVVEWAKKHKNDGELKPGEKVLMTPWDKKFFKVDQETLFNILLVAHHLGNERLKDVGCQVVAKQISGKSAEEIRKKFGIINDFTPEQEQLIKEECPRRNF